MNATIPQQFFKHGSSLALFRRISDMQNHWDAQWMSGGIKAFLDKGRSGELGEFERPFVAHLPKNGTILEAGCGTGRFVAALRARGYDVEGVDYAAETIKAILTIDPTLKVRAGDIFAIDRPDGYYAGYVSIGVLEHNFAGPGAGLREACRVLRPGGIAVITVPQLNSARRRIWNRSAPAPGPESTDGLRFYQDHLDPVVFRAQLIEAGFEVIEVYPYELFGGLIRDWSIGRYLSAKGFFSYRLRKSIKRLCAGAPRSLKQRHSHMLAFVCRRKWGLASG